MSINGTDFALVGGTIVWVSVIVWMAKRGWLIHREYMAAEMRKPMTRNAFVWTAAVIGALTLIASHQRPGAPGIILVAMVGSAASYIDIQTHRLPDRLTLVMAFGVLVGWATAFAVDPELFLGRFTSSLLGALIWVTPMLLGRMLRTSVGLGDVKLAPVLGALVGMVGVPAALFSMILTYVLAGFAALWLIFTGSTSVHARIPLGPWMVGCAIAGYLLWGIIPDWLGGVTSLNLPTP